MLIFNVLFSINQWPNWIPFISQFFNRKFCLFYQILFTFLFCFTFFLLTCFHLGFVEVIYFKHSECFSTDSICLCFWDHYGFFWVNLLEWNVCCWSCLCLFLCIGIQTKTNESKLANSIHLSLIFMYFDFVLFWEQGFPFQEFNIIT